MGFVNGYMTLDYFAFLKKSNKNMWYVYEKLPDWCLKAIELQFE